MTREEAAKEIKKTIEQLSVYMPHDDDWVVALTLAIATLHSQQTPAKLDRSRYEECPDCKGEVFAKRRQYMRHVMKPLTPEQALMDKLTELTGIVYVKVKNEFCHTCGRPLTEESWAELERRMSGG